MIEKKEIDTKAKKFEIHPSNVERDYVFGWLLFGLFTISDLKNEVFLKGGNALRKGYFENTRFSSDIDLGIPGDIDQKKLKDEINKVCKFIQEKTGVTFNINDNTIEEKFSASEAPLPDLKVYEVRVYFKDFYGKSDHINIKISMDITRFDKVLLPIQNVELIHPYSDSRNIQCKIRCMKLEEIIATKLKCLLQRQYAPDLFDYVHTIKLLGGSINKEEIVNTFIEKTIFDKNPHVVKDILCKTPYDCFEKFWYKSVVYTKKLLFGLEEAIAFLISDLEKLFAIFPDNNYQDFAYFGAELRVPIMEAGRTQTLLKMKYKGEERIIEPYSLKYLERLNGAQREYFYGYNQSGGSSLPGIRCFIAQNVDSISNTDEKFKPRFQIELSKAGETPENPYMFDPDWQVPHILNT